MDESIGMLGRLMMSSRFHAGSCVAWTIRANKTQILFASNLPCFYALATSSSVSSSDSLIMIGDAWVRGDVTIRAMHVEPHNLCFISCAADYRLPDAIAFRTCNPDLHITLQCAVGFQLYRHQKLIAALIIWLQIRGFPTQCN